jgi:hypothetical protein
MRNARKWLAGMVMCATVAPPALGGLVVTSYRTVASTNGYAPVSQAQYFAEQRLENVSPAIAEVSGDWTGPNADGTPNTWHFVGTSRATSTTTITADSYTVEAAASFAYQVDTTADFIDPRSTSVFGFGVAAQYRGFFETDVPIMYSITARLNQQVDVRLSLIGGTIIFNESNPSSTPRILTLAGTIPPGRYQFLAGTGLSGPILPNGINHFGASGSVENLVFTVRVPEPNAIGIGAALVAVRLRQRRPRVAGIS